MVSAAGEGSFSTTQCQGNGKGCRFWKGECSACRFYTWNQMKPLSLY